VEDPGGFDLWPEPVMATSRPYTATWFIEHDTPDIRTSPLMAENEIVKLFAEYF
jgi:hypothetical protein